MKNKFNTGDRVIVSDCGLPFPGEVLGYTENIYGRKLVRVRLDGEYRSETVWYESEVRLEAEA